MPTADCHRRTATSQHKNTSESSSSMIPPLHLRSERIHSRQEDSKPPLHRKTSPSQQPVQKKSRNNQRMTPIDWNERPTIRHNSCGRFGEPEESFSSYSEPLKLPKRRGSDDSGNEDDAEIPCLGSKKEQEQTIPTLVDESRPQKPRRRRGYDRHRYQSRYNRGSFSSGTGSEDFWINQIETEEKSNEMAPIVSKGSRRRASFGSRPSIRKYSLGQQLDQETKENQSPSRPAFGRNELRRSVSLTRPCMEPSRTTSVDSAPSQRRVSLGGTRPCMGDTSPAGDAPILRPYRQLSSEHLSIDFLDIEEETEEDLSHRSRRTADLSNRSNRTCFRNSAKEFSNRSNRTPFRATAPTNDFLSAQQAAAIVKEEDEAEQEAAKAKNEVPDWARAESSTTRPLSSTDSTAVDDSGPDEDPLSTKSKKWPKILLTIRKKAMKSLLHGEDKEESGAFLSGAFRSGPFSSGAFRSGAFRSGAFRSGAFRSGAFQSLQGFKRRIMKKRTSLTGKKKFSETISQANDILGEESRL